jgi:uncharacterized membrane protein YbaN (DUF454 family)
VRLLAGFFGWLLPVMTGIPFFALGLVLVAMGSGRARRWVNRIEDRLPARLRSWLRRLLSRVRSRRLRNVLNLPPERR